MFTRRRIPNLLTAFRVAAIPLIVAALYLRPACWALPFGLFLAAALSDFLDGWCARRWEVKSDFGRMLDPIADKLLVAAVLVTLIDLGTLSGWHALPVLVILLRELLVSGLREYMAGRDAVLHVSRLAKWKTAAQLTAVGALLFPPAGLAGIALLWIAAALTLLTGYQYSRAVSRALAGG